MEYFIQFSFGILLQVFFFFFLEPETNISLFIRGCANGTC